MFNDKFKGVIVGLLVGSTLSGSVAFAKTGSQMIEAAYADIKLYIDGIQLEPKDADGNSVEPFIYNGTTYLPVRAVGEAVGKTVKWDGETKSVYLGHTEDSTQYMTDVCPAYQISNYKDSYTEYSEIKSQGKKYFTMAGVKYANGCVFCNFVDEDDCYALYNLNGKYSKIEGVLGHIDGDNIESGILNIYKDGILAEEIEINAEMIPVNLGIDVKGVLQLKLQVTGDNVNYGIGNMTIR